jgi:hypothetical protein
MFGTLLLQESQLPAQRSMCAITMGLESVSGEQRNARSSARWRESGLMVEREQRPHHELSQKWATTPELLTEEEKAEGRPGEEKRLQLQGQINKLLA